MAKQRFGAGGVPYAGHQGEHGEVPAAPEVTVDVTETETPGDIPKG